VTNYKTKTNRSTTPRGTYIDAATEVLAESSCLRQASGKYSVNFTTHQRFRKKLGGGGVGR